MKKANILNNKKNIEVNKYKSELDYLNLKNLFKNDSILSELIRSEILFNNNLNLDLNLYQEM